MSRTWSQVRRSAVRATTIGLPARSVMRGSVLPSPRDSALTADRRPLCGPRRVLVGPNTAAIDHRQRTVQGPVMGAVGLEGEQDAVPPPSLPPPPQPGVHGRPRPIPVGQIAPGRAGSQNPDDPVEHGPVIPRGASGAWALRGPQGREPLPLVVGEFVSSLWAQAPNRA